MLEWAHKILAAGEAFSGVECVSLRSMLTAQSSNFFSVYHSSNLEALHSMLDKELWRRLPSLAEGDVSSDNVFCCVKADRSVVVNPSDTCSTVPAWPDMLGAQNSNFFNFHTMTRNIHMCRETIC